MQNFDQKKLGKGLGEMHLNSAESNPKMFGFPVEGFIGVTDQKKGWEDNWIDCFLNLRIIPQLLMLKSKILEKETINNIKEKIQSELLNHKPINALVHGDFMLGNIIVSQDGLQSIIDWELAHVGNPLQDLGWICGNSWRFGNTDKVVGGFGDLKDLLDGYNSISEYQVDQETVRAWQVFGTFRWGVICLIQASAHLNGTINSVEKAAIGRRVSETEIDIVDLLFLGGR